MPFVNEKTGKVADGELVVFPGETGGDVDGIGVLVDANGDVTNRWGDGTVGLPDELRESAAEETEAYEPHTMNRFVWRHDVLPILTTAPLTKHRTRKQVKAHSRTTPGSPALKALK